MLRALLFLALKSLVVYSSDLPPYFPKCCIDDPYLDDCLISASNYIRPYLQDGLRDIELTGLDPAVLPKLIIMDEGQDTNYTLNASNFSFYNVHNYVMKEMHYDTETLTLFGRFYHENIPYNAVAEAGPPGKLLDFEVTGTSGTLEGYLSGVVTSFETTGQLVKRNGKEYYKPLDTRAFIIMRDSILKVDGIFGSDKELERKANEWFSGSTKIVAKTLSPMYEKLARSFIHMYIASLSKNVPYANLFPTCYDSSILWSL